MAMARSFLRRWPLYFEYMRQRFEYSANLTGQTFRGNGQITRKELGDYVLKNFFKGQMTYLHWNEGEEMAPTIAAQGGTLLVRKLLFVNPAHFVRHVFVGDVVVIKDPEKSGNHLVRRLAAVEGHAMMPKDEKDEPFVLDKDQCWVLADNENLKPKEANDSRIFGPVQVTDIVGRVLYNMRTAVDHCPVQNSDSSMKMDLPVLEVELDVYEMAKNHKA